jgi:hypothetical protein
MDIEKTQRCILKQVKYIALLALLACSAPGAWAQGFRTEFGKNRLQTKPYDWKFFKNDQFDVYYYLTGRDLAVFVAQEAGYHINEIESFFDFRLDDKIQFVLYNSKLDYGQSNMFLERDAYNIGGTTRIIGATCFIYYPGNHFDFVRNIRQGVGQVVINEMLYGGSVQERIQNATLLHLPDWYVNGLVNHVSLGWDHELDSRLKNAILSGKLKKMGALKKENRDLVSQAMWMYIDRRYGKDVISNILYVSRVNKNLESGYLYVLGKNLWEVYDEWYQFTLGYYQNQALTGNEYSERIALNKRLFKNKAATHMALSHDQGHLALATNMLGKVKLYTVDMATGQAQKIFAMGYKSLSNEPDFSYPVFCWDSRKRVLHYVYEKKGVPWYVQYDLATKGTVRKEPLTQIQRVYSMSMSPDGRSIAISGLKNGRTDIMVLDATTAFVRSITNDDYDDLDPFFTKGGEEIVFSSNRPSTAFKELKKFQNNFDFAESFDLYSYDYKGKAESFSRITHTPSFNETQPRMYGDSLLAFVHDESGYLNLGILEQHHRYDGLQVIVKKKNNLISPNDTVYLPSKADYEAFIKEMDDSAYANISRIDTQGVFFDTAHLYQATDYSENVMHYELTREGKAYHLGMHDNLYGVFATQLKPMGQLVPLKGGQARNYMGMMADPVNDEVNNSNDGPSPKDSFPYYFITGFEDLATQGDENEGKEQAPLLDSKKNLVNSGRDDETGRDQSSYYFLAFAPDEVITQFDIGYFNTPYLPYAPGDNSVNFPGLRGLSRIAVSDMFKDYRLEGGVRPSVNLNSLDYFGRYQNFKKRMDKELAYYRMGNRESNDTTSLKTVVQELRYVLKYPFTEVAALRGHVFARQDNKVALATSRDALLAEPVPVYWVGGKVEFVYDNTMADGVNTLYGTRYKLYYENFTQLADNKILHIVGGDFRSYLKIYRNFIWANRLAFASSLGKHKVVYFLGGTENWLAPRFNNEISVDEERDYVFKSGAVNLRGFQQNIRNGASYCVVNSEFRLPLFRFFSNKPLKSNFLENFQVVGFGDIGVAFNGYSPFDEENAFNKKVFYADPVRVERWSLRKPVVGGYGFGLRSNVLGYFVRLDWAWGREAGIEPNRVVYLSLGTDF